jgi:hypothetical protein
MKSHDGRLVGAHLRYSILLVCQPKYYSTLNGELCATPGAARTMDAQLSRSSIHSTSGFNAERARLGLGAVPSCVVLALRTVLLFLSL